MDNNHSGQTLQAGSSEKLLPSAPASTSPFPPDVKATTGLTEVQVQHKNYTFKSSNMTPQTSTTHALVGKIVNANPIKRHQ